MKNLSLTMLIMKLMIKPGAFPRQSSPPLCQGFHPGVEQGEEEVAPGNIQELLKI